MTSTPDPAGPATAEATAPFDVDGRIRLANDPAFMADPYPTYARWRDAGPVLRVRTPEGSNAWLLTRYDDVRTALTDPTLSLSRTHARPGNYHGFSLPATLDANLLNLDPPDHTRLRRLVAPTFTTDRIQRLRPDIQQRARTLADTVANTIGADGHADLIGLYAAPLTLTTIGGLFGLGSDQLAGFRTWTTALLAPDPSGSISPGQAVTALADFLDHLVRDRRAEPGDDLLSDLITAQHDDDRLTDPELTSLAFLLLWAGYENSLNVIGNAVLALLQHPDQAAALAHSDPTGQDDLSDAGIEELLRYAHPNHVHIRRFPTRDLTIEGTPIRRGDTILLAGAAIHRDPHHFPDPDHLDLTRSPNPHLAFGHGIHHCLGAPLARLHLGIAISVLFRRLPDLTLATPVDHLSWQPSWRSRGLRTLPVRTATAPSGACPPGWDTGSAGTTA